MCFVVQISHFELPTADEAPKVVAAPVIKLPDKPMELDTSKHGPNISLTGTLTATKQTANTYEVLICSSHNTSCVRSLPRC
jgi:hypothetical protein